MTMIWEKFSARLAGRTAMTAFLGVGLAMVGGCSGGEAREHRYPEQIGGSEQHDPLGTSTSSDEQVGSLLDRDGLVGKLIKRDGEETAEDGGGNAAEDGAEATDEVPGEAPEDADAAGADEISGAGAAEEETKAAEDADGEYNVAQRHDPKKLGVNGYLWRATLETLSFLPLSSADPYGGVIITDWRTNPQAPGERVKVTVYILDKKLRADGVRVSVFRQVLSPGGTWVDQPASDDTRIKLEEAILTRARQLRVSDISND